jgi:Arc/MetJ-type ribon-helix-helix transcriptional regulator
VGKQLTVRLPDDLARALARRARTTGERPSDIVRSALREHLELVPARGGRPIDRVRHLVGCLDSGKPDLAERHREYILESLRRGR